MKKDKSLFLLYAFLILSASCTRNITEDWSGKMLVFRTPHYLGTSTSSVLFNDGNGGKQTLSISSTNTSWEITELPEWLNADKTVGEVSASITFTCLANPSPKTARAAVFYIRSKEKDWEYSIPVSVSQVRCLSYAIPAQTTISFEGKEGSQTISVNSNIDDWNVISSESWLTVEKNAGGSVATLSVTPNPNKTSRRAYVTIQTEDEERQITVDQRAGNISATMDKLDFSVEAEKKTITITSDASWTAQSSSSWIEINPSSGNAGSTEVSVRSTANNSFSKRSGYIYFIMADDNKIELPIEQEEVSFSLSTSSLEFDRTESTKTITIFTNTEWELASSLPDWLSLSAKEGRGTTVVTITAKENQDATVAPRSHTISFKPKAIDKNFDVVLSQNGQRMNYEITPLQFTNKSGSLPFSFEATGNWSVSTSDSWITVSPSSGVGDATCVVTVAENKGDERIGEVVLTFYEETYCIPVTQQGVFLTLSTNGLQFGSKGGALQVDITSNTSWEAIVKDETEWLSVNPTQGEEKGTLTITAADNPSASSRDGEILVTLESSQPLIVSIEQAARFLNVSTNSIDFLASGGTSELITVDTDGTFEVTTESDWLTVNKVGDKSFTVTADEYNDIYSRKGSLIVSLTNLISGKIEKTIAIQQKGKHNGHELVDLGLPSGTLWATMNVGANSPEDYGDYFAWGETTKKSTYDWSTYKWCNGSETILTKYNTSSDCGTVDNKIVLELSDDAANVNWGGSWRMPTREEWRELCNTDNCTWTWTTQGGHYGRMVTSKSNGNSVFLPAAGRRRGSDLFSAGDGGEYWSSSLRSDLPYNACCVWFDSGSVGGWNNTYRYDGFSVRPVCQPNSSFFEVSKDIIAFAAAGGTESVTLTTNLSWTAMASESWITPSTTAGSGNATLSVTAEENTSPSSRSGVITFMAGGNTYMVTVTQSTPEGKGEINGHYYVDLDLPSGLLWATMNVGANSPEDYGDYFAWGESTTKGSYEWGAYKWCNGTINSFTKYNGDPYFGKVDNKFVLDLEDDAAHVNWGEGWRMPTKDELEELIDNCTWTWTTQGGHNGYKVFSNSNGNSIFLPAAGSRVGSFLDYTESYGLFWSSLLSFKTSDPSYAWILCFNSSGPYMDVNDRKRGHSVRPVYLPN